MRHRLSGNLIVLIILCGVLMIAGAYAFAQDNAEDAEPLACEVTLEGLWALTSDACATGPMGFICNGGSSPQVQPAGAVENSLSAVGALVETDVVDAVQTLPIITEVIGGGLMWMRWGDPHYATGLLVGEVAVEDVTSDEFPAWSSMVVRTGTDRPDCPTTPHNSFALQAQSGIRSRLVVNGVSIDLAGTIIIRTIDDVTVFVGLAGRNTLIVRGIEYPVWNGQELIVPYANGDFSQPAGFPDRTLPLDATLVEFFPSGLLDQPLWIPQPGYVQTEGLVNMRAEPSLEGTLIAQIPAGTLMSVLGQNDARDWYHVSLNNGFSGWMYASLLQQNTLLVRNSYEATPVPPQRFGTLNTIARVRAPSGLNIRENPDVQFRSLGVLPNGTQVDMLARSPYSPWVNVRTENGTVGWVALIALDTRSNVNALPIETNVVYPPQPVFDAVSPNVLDPGAWGNAFPDPRNPSF